MNPVILKLAPDASVSAGDGSGGKVAKSGASGDPDGFRVLLDHRLFAAQIGSKSPLGPVLADALKPPPTAHANAGATTALPDLDLETIREPLIDVGPAQNDSGETSSTPSSAREAATSSSIQSAALQTRFAANASIALQIDTFNIQSGAQASATQPAVDAQIAKMLASISSRSQIAAAASPSVQAALLAPVGNTALLAPVGNTGPLVPKGKSAPIAPKGSTAPVAPEGKTDALATQRALDAKISKLIESGASQADIIGSLAAQLATSVSGQLGLSSADALGKLQTIFATALGSPNQSAESGAVSDRARSLAQRFIGLERVASTIASGQSGQQNRIAGKLLDAPAAKDIPAQTTTNDPLIASTSAVPAPILSAHSATSSATAAVVSAQAASSATASAQAASSATASAQAASSATASAQAAPGAVAFAVPAPALTASTRRAGDGRTVQLGATPAIATGGDTGLGRILTRASLAADAREAPVATSSPSVAPAPTSATLASASKSGSVSFVSNSASVAFVPDSASVALAPDSASVASAPTSASVAFVPDSASVASAPTSANAAFVPDPASAALMQNSVPVASASVAGSSGKSLAAFVKSFDAALKGITTLNAPQATRSDSQPATSSSPLQPAAGDATPSFMPAVAPFNIDRAEHVPAPAAATPVPIDHSAIADQVLRGAFMRNVGESSEIRLRLVPESMGDVNVKLVVSDGSVTAHVVAETAEVRDALVAAQPQLTKSFADAGLKLTGFTVDVSGGGFAGFAGQSNDQSQNGGRSRRWTNTADQKDVQDETRLEAIPSFGPSVAPRANPGDFNYLA